MYARFINTNTYEYILYVYAYVCVCVFLYENVVKKHTNIFVFVSRFK